MWMNQLLVLVGVAHVSDVLLRWDYPGLTWRAFAIGECLEMEGIASDCSNSAQRKPSPGVGFDFPSLGQSYSSWPLTR